MEEQCSPLTWAYYYQEEGVEELKHSLLYSTLELEAAVISAHEEISRKDDEILQLKVLVAKIMKERDEFQTKYQQLVLEKQLLFQQVQIHTHSLKHGPISSSGTTSSQDDDDNNNNIDMSLSDSDDNTAPPPPTTLDVIDRIPLKKPLPEQGKLLQAVMEAGPLLQTLLLAGPLPQWQHPPPQLNSADIPPVTISSPTEPPKILHQDSCFTITNKRPMVNSDFSANSKYQKVCSPIT